MKYPVVRLPLIVGIALLVGAGTWLFGGFEFAAPRPTSAQKPIQFGGDEGSYARLVASLPPEQQAKLRRKETKPPKAYNNPDDAQRYFLDQRTGGDPLDYSLLEAAKEELAQMPRAWIGPVGFEMNGEFLSPGQKAAGDIIAWTELGPGNIGGRTRALLIDPASNQNMYAAGVAGGVWKTTNGGGTWAPLDDLMDNLAVCTLAFAGQGGASLDTSIIYAGTGEGFFNGDSVRGAGIFKSTDSGVTWSQLSATNISDFNYVTKIVASPNAVGTLYASTWSGVWKTTDAGANWTLMLANDGVGGTGDTGGFDVLLDIEIRTDVSPDVLIADARSDGIFRTTDAGSTWSQVFTHASKRRADLAIAPSNQAVMYALVASSSSNLLNVYRSVDGGATWTARVAGVFNSGVLDWLLLTNPLYPTNHQGWYDNIIAVAPHNSSIVFAGGIDLFRSDDGGANWGQISYWWKTPGTSQYAHADQHMIAFDPGWNGTSNQIMTVGNDGGMQQTANALATRDMVGNQSTSLVSWAGLNSNYGVTQFYHGRPLASGTDGYFGGAQDNGTLAGSDAAGLNGWVEVNGGDGGYVSYSQTNPNVFFAEYQRLAIRRSTTGINGSYSYITNGIVDSGFSFIVPFRHDPSDDDVLWTGGDRAWRSTNATSQAVASNVNWVQASTVVGSSASAFAIDPNDSDNVWMASFGTLRQTNNGTTANSATVWTDRTPSGTSSYRKSWIEVDANDTTGNTVYVTHSTYTGGGKHVYKTTNRGTNWTDISGNLPDIPVHCVVVQPYFSNNIFVGTELGVFASQDGGSTWASMNTNGFANTVVEAIEFQTATKLYAFTHGRGVFRATVVRDDFIVTGAPFSSSGVVGGPFTPQNAMYNLLNTGASSINWTATKTKSWVTLPSSGGALSSGANTDVTVTINSGANALAIGQHVDTVTFTDTTNNVVFQTTVTLDVQPPPPVTIQAFDLSTDPGWTRDGAWAYGVPTGHVGNNSLGQFGQDPSSGKTGSNVYGFELLGQYFNNLPERYLVTTAIDCTGYTNVSLTFWRWLGVESSTFDNARIDVSDDNSTWTNVWTHSGSAISDTSWVEQTFDISSVADNNSTVYVRWVMGTTDSSVTYGGWNIDDVTIQGNPPAPTNLSEAWVDFAYAGPQLGTQSNPFRSLDGAVTALKNDGTGVIKIKGDTADSASDETPRLTKPMTIQAINGAVRIGEP
jgi:photosystem II stability/assembly factor-like uncharacterized protein